MTATELYNLLKTLNLPVAYDHFEQKTNAKVEPPFIVYREDEPFTKKAEDVTWHKSNNYIVELATDIKDVELEETLEQLFTNNDLPYDKEETYIDDERIFQIRYYIS